MSAILKALHLSPKHPVSLEPDARSASHFSQWIDDRLGDLYKEMQNGASEKAYNDMKDFFPLAEAALSKYDEATQAKLQKKLTNWKVKIVAAQKKKFLSVHSPLMKNLDNSVDSLKKRQDVLKEKILSLLAKDDANKSEELEPFELPSLQEYQDKERLVEGIFQQVSCLQQDAPEGAKKDLEEMSAKILHSKNNVFLVEKGIKTISSFQEVVASHKQIREALPALLEQESAAARALDYFINSLSHQKDFTIKHEMIIRMQKEMAAAMVGLEMQISPLRTRYPLLPLVIKTDALLHRASQQMTKFQNYEQLLKSFNALNDWLTRKTENIEYSVEKLGLIEQSGFHITELQQAIKSYLTPKQGPDKFYLVNRLEICRILKHIPRLKESSDAEFQAVIQKAEKSVEKTQRQVHETEQPPSLLQRILSSFWAIFSWLGSIFKR